MTTSGMSWPGWVEDCRLDGKDILDHRRGQHVRRLSFCHQSTVFQETDMVGDGRSEVQIMEHRKHRPPCHRKNPGRPPAPCC